MIKGIYKPENISNQKLAELQMIETSSDIRIVVANRYCSDLVSFNIKTGHITRCKWVNKDFNLYLDNLGRLNYS